MSPHEAQQHLTVGEFSRRMESLERTIQSGQRQSEARFDNVDKTLADTRERLAVVEAAKRDDLADVAAVARQHVRSNAKKSAGWSAVVASGIMLAVEAIKAVSAWAK